MAFFTHSLDSSANHSSFRSIFAASLRNVSSSNIRRFFIIVRTVRWYAGVTDKRKVGIPLGTKKVKHFSEKLSKLSLTKACHNTPCLLMPRSGRVEGLFLFHSTLFFAMFLATWTCIPDTSPKIESGVSLTHFSRTCRARRCSSIQICAPASSIAGLWPEI